MSSYLLAINYTTFTSKMDELIESMLTPLITLALGLAAVWGFYLGMKFWLSAGDENKRKEAKSAFISFVVGIVVIFAVIVGAPLLITAFATWAELV